MMMQRAAVHSAVASAAASRVESVVRAGVGAVMTAPVAPLPRTMSTPPPPPPPPLQQLLLKTPKRRFSVAGQGRAGHPRGCTCRVCAPGAATALARASAHPRGCACDGCDGRRQFASAAH